MTKSSSAALSRTTSDRDLLLELRPGRGSRIALEQALRDAIREGRLLAGAVLPSTRALARDLGIARSTVSEAYAQLTAAGYLLSHQGAGTWVASGAARVQLDTVDLAPAAAPRFDFRPHAPDLSSFPRALWQRALRRGLAKATPDVFGSGDPQGRPELRGALAEYLPRARGVVTTPARLIVCNGFSQGLKMICDVLRSRGASRVGVEDPSLWRLAEIVRTAGLETVPIPVDGEGLVVEGLDDLDVAAVLVTPAHQFPLGPTMGSARRAALLAWAKRQDAIVIEDDYDGEFRYDRRPIGALQGLDPNRVVYAGTAAKTLAPGVRLGWLSLPPWMLGPAVEIRSVVERFAGVLDQLALAQLIESGDLDRHVRAMRRIYRWRRDMLVSAVSRATPNLRIRGVEAGLHAVLELPDHLHESELLVRAERCSIGLHGLEPYRHGVYVGPQALLVSYGRPPDHAFSASLRALTALLHGEPASP